MSEYTAAQTQKLMADLRLVVVDAEKLLDATAEQAGEGAAELRSRVRASLAQAKAGLSHLQDAAVERAKAAGQATDVYVHENPWKSIGVAAGIGLLVGVLIGRR
ncbi:MAG: YqjD family protein [Leptothrix sp. (in: b-proteobacteria)]